MCTLISLLPTQSQGTEHCKQADFVIKTDDDVYIILFAAYTITSYNVSMQADFVILTNDDFNIDLFAAFMYKQTFPTTKQTFPTTVGGLVGLNRPAVNALSELRRGYMPIS